MGRKIFRIGAIAGCALSMLCPLHVSAQQIDGGQQQKMIEKELDKVMVTASRLELPVNQVARLVTVVTKEQIAEAPVQSVQDLLVYVANIDVIQRGVHGVQADISIRGGSGDQNAILLNGINLSNGQTGHYSFDIPVNISDIERIEIIHGPSALIYGASAFSGGINIITRKSLENEIYVRAEAGGHDLRGAELRAATAAGAMINSLSVGSNSSDGYISNTDYALRNVLWQTRFNLKGESKLDLQLGYNDKKYGANNFYSAKFPNQYDRTSSYLGSMKGEFGSKFKVIPILYWDRHNDHFDLVKDTDFGRNYHRADTYGANLIFAYRSKLGTTSLGSELRREDIMSSVLGKPMAEPSEKYKNYDDRTNLSAALEHTVSLKKVVLSAGMLMNHNTLSDEEYDFFPSVSVSYRPAERVDISSSWSKSTRMPTFTDLYYTTETHDGNDGLRPEKSESFELGFKYLDSFVSAYATGFLMWGRDIIDWVDVNGKWASWNHTKLDTEGVELGMKFRLGKFMPVLGKNSFLAVDYARMHQNVDTDNMKSSYSLNYLRDKFVAQFSHRLFGGFSAGWFFRYQKRMGTYEKFENLVKVGDEPYPAFSTLDVKLIYTYKNLALNINMNNLCNTTYFDRGNIPQPGFWLMGGVGYKFN